jgi:DNA-binding PadR family transcriptional regulator
MSPGIYRDLDSLVAQGLLEQHPVPGKRWSRYAATDRGREAAEARLRRLETDEEKLKAKCLYDIKQDIATVSFNALLDRVYREHPDMAARSVFRSQH